LSGSDGLKSRGVAIYYYRLDYQGDEVFEVTEKASAMIKSFLKDREEFPAIRLMLSGG